MTNIKKALSKYLLNDAELMAIFKRVFPVFNPVSSAQLNKRLLLSIYPCITVVEVKPELDYSENSVIQGYKKTEVQIDFVELIDLAKMTSPVDAQRDEENKKIFKFDEIVEKWKFKILEDYKKPAEMHGAAIHQLLITDELGTDEQIDMEIAENFELYRESVRFSIIYNPMINTGEEE
jgi:hypothetical protein